MSVLAIVTHHCNGITEVNGTQHIVYFEAFVYGGRGEGIFQGVVQCECLIDASDNSNKLRDCYIDAVVTAAATRGVFLQTSDVVMTQFYRPAN